MIVSCPEGTIGPIDPDTFDSNNGCSTAKGTVVRGSSVYSSVADASISGRMARLIASRAAADAGPLAA